MRLIFSAKKLFTSIEIVSSHYFFHYHTTIQPLFLHNKSTMVATHNSPKEDHNRNTFVADPANDGSNKENEDNKTTTKPSTNNSIVVKKDADALTLSSKQTNTTVPSSKDNSKTEIASSDEESSLASSIDSEEFREQVTFCRLDENTYKEELSTAMKAIDLRGNSRNGKSSQQPRRRPALGDISNQKASSQSKKSTSKKGRAPRCTVKMPLK